MNHILPLMQADLVRELFPHQAAEKRHLLQSGVAHRALFRQMGCGKGVLAVSYGAELPGPKLACVPTSTKEQFRCEIHRFAPGARVQVLYGRKAQIDPDADWCVLNYELLLSDPLFHQLLDRRWSLLVLDEFHLLRTPTAERTRRVLGTQPCLAGQADHVLALSGTSVVNSPRDLYPLINRLFPYAIATTAANGKRHRMQLAEYVDHYCTIRHIKVGGRTIEQIVGGKNLPELRERIAPYVSRLRLADVLDLPALHVTDFALTVEIGDALDDVMKDLPLGLVEALQQADDDALPGLLRQYSPELASLRRVLGTLKAPAAAEHILERLDGGADRVLAFHHHRTVGDIMLDQLRCAGVATAMIRGDTPSGARARAIDALTAGELQVLLLQNEAGSLGLNLQAARRAVIVEPAWTDATTQQSIGRIHRAGQLRDCIVEFLLIPGTLDEHVTGVARRKAQLAAELIETQNMENA